MRHHILVKFIEGTDVDARIAPIREIFAGTLSIPGVRKVEIKRNCVDRPNRYDLMIVLEMDPEALPVYDESEPHKRWKTEYGPITAQKAIFDCE